MIHTEDCMTRKDGVVLIRTWSDAKVMIENENGVRYAEAIDVKGHTHVYKETDEAIEEEGHDTEHEVA